MKKYNRTLFIFRRDLRLEDNLGLLDALENSEKVIPIFIFDDRQINKKKNEYFGENSFQFMINSLKELEKDLNNRKGKLFLFKGDYKTILDKLIISENIEAVYGNKDYTPFSRKRDKEIENVCNKNRIDFYRVADYVLSDIENVKTGTGNRYSVFTPFMKKASEKKVDGPIKNNFSNYYSRNIKNTIKLSEFDNYENKDLMLQGRRSEALDLMKRESIPKNYKKNRDLPAIDGTSKLSAHIKFGTISIREVYEWGKESSTFISELYWRDFYLYISYHFPEVFKKSFQERGENIKWINDKKHFERWKKGETGVPIVDAGMRQLNKIGWMHNRVRMIVASYLTKNLLIDWRWGEKYFAQKLIDYDPSSNNGGWQWSASVGADPKPIRIFNPYTQVQKYDSSAEYIKEWVDELKDVEDDLLTDGRDKDFSEFANYSKPIVDQKESYHRAMEVYKEAKN
jgi:deoxyribodipyrimidine photo-lyase